jgi:DNA-binding transcriptional LysR family regulator
MEINYIKEFVILAEIGNYLEAADHLYISQSSLSRHIKTLEEEFGSPLFDRTTRKVSLNEFGQTFLPYARKIAQLQYEYSSALMSKLQDISGTVTIGSIPTMSQYGITNLLAQFKRDNPNFSLSIVEADSNSLINMMHHNQCDFAFIRDYGTIPDELAKIPYTIDSIVAVLPKNHPLAANGQATLNQIKNENFLLLGPNTMMYDLCISACKLSGFYPNIVFVGKRAESMISLVEQGLGIALLTKKPAQFFATENVAMIDILPSICTSIDLVYNKENKMNVIARHFLDWIKSCDFSTV